MPSPPPPEAKSPLEWSETRDGAPALLIRGGAGHEVRATFTARLAELGFSWSTSVSEVGPGDLLLPVDVPEEAWLHDEADLPVVVPPGMIGAEVAAETPGRHVRRMPDETSGCLQNLQVRVQESYGTFDDLHEDNRSTTYDVLRMFWDLTTDQSLSPDKLSDVFVDMCSRAWVALDPPNTTDGLPLVRLGISASFNEVSTEVNNEITHIAH